MKKKIDNTSQYVPTICKKYYYPSLKRPSEVNKRLPNLQNRTKQTHPSSHAFQFPGHHRGKQHTLNAFAASEHIFWPLTHVGPPLEKNVIVICVRPTVLQILNITNPYDYDGAQQCQLHIKYWFLLVTFF